MIDESPVPDGALVTGDDDVGKTNYNHQ